MGSLSLYKWYLTFLSLTQESSCFMLHSFPFFHSCCIYQELALFAQTVSKRNHVNASHIYALLYCLFTVKYIPNFVSLNSGRPNNSRQFPCTMCIVPVVVLPKLFPCASCYGLCTVLSVPGFPVDFLLHLQCSSKMRNWFTFFRAHLLSVKADEGNSYKVQASLEGMGGCSSAPHLCHWSIVQYHRSCSISLIFLLPNCLHCSESHDMNVWYGCGN